MKKQYVVTASGAKKKTGESYSMCACIISAKGQSFLSDRDRIFLDDIRPVGSIVEVEQNVVGK